MLGPYFFLSSNRNMSIEYRIAELNDVEFVLNYIKKSSFLKNLDQMDAMMKLWDSSYRQESLEHYFKLGWSFVALQNGQLKGFFLGQPILFFMTKTQTLWVECILADDLKIQSELTDIAVKLSKDKHFQNVILPEEVENASYIVKPAFQKLNWPSLIVKTTK